MVVMPVVGALSRNSRTSQEQWTSVMPVVGVGLPPNPIGS